MKAIRLGLTVGALQLCIVLTGAAQAPQTPSEAVKVQAWQAFETFHREVLLKRCTTCHSAAGFRMPIQPTAVEAALSLLRGGYVVAGSLEQSKVFYRINGNGWFSSTMPPRGFDSDSAKDKELRAAALQLLGTWIKAGAPIPRNQ